MAKARGKGGGVSDDKPAFDVAFGSVGIGKSAARIGVTVARDGVSLSRCEGLFCGRRLTVSVKARRNGDAMDQPSLQGMEDDLELTGIADVKKFTVGVDSISFSASFSRREKGVAGLQEFSGLSGRLEILDNEDIPDDEDGEEDDGEE
jgi:hypothetical protein